MKRYLVLYTVVFVVLAIAIGFAARRDAREGAPPVPSTHILGPEGYRAAWRLLEDIGVPVERHLLPLDELAAGDGNLLILAGPRARPVTELEASSLKAWVSSGNTLLWFSRMGDPRTYAGSMATISTGVVEAETAEGKLAWAFDAVFDHGDLSQAAELERYLPVHVDTAFTEGVHEIYVGPSVDLQVSGAEWLPIAGSVRGGSVRLQELGKGRVWFFPTPHVLDNGGLVRGDNVLFLRNLVRRELRGGKVFFDEYHHGYSLSPIGSIVVSPVFRMILFQCVALFLLYIWARTWRFGPPVPMERDPRRPAFEYLLAMAELFRRGGKSREMAEGLVRGFRIRLEKRSAILRGLPDHEAMRLLERRTGRRWKELGGWLEAVDHGRVDRPRHLLRLAQALRQAERAVGE